jgi:hypothetical protein
MRFADLVWTFAKSAWRGANVDRQEAVNKLWCAELMARLELLDRMILERSIRQEFVLEQGSKPASFEKRSKLLEVTRRQYSALLKQHLLDGKLPTSLSGELNPGVPSTACFVPDGAQTR